MDRWRECPPDVVTLDDLRGRPCYAGLDLSSTRDITALVLYCREDHSVLPFFWVPRRAAETRERRNLLPFARWAAEGHITMTDGDAVDYSVVLETIESVGAVVDLAQVAVDRWNSEHIQQQLMARGVDVVQWGQGFASMSGPSKELEKLIVARTLRHGHHPVMRWMAGNAVAKIDEAGNVKPNKGRSADKIDGIVALIMAIGAAMLTPVPKPSVYERRGVIKL
jgi:phage terminase large subunit-like protein